MANEQTRISLRRLATFLAKLKDIFASKTDLANKQDKLKWDSTPTSGSSNPVTSDGVKKALDGKQAAGNYMLNGSAIPNNDLGLWDYLHRFGLNYAPPTNNAGVNAKGIFISCYNKQVIANQPAQYGQLINLTADKGEEATQLWLSQWSGELWHRGGNASNAVNSQPFLKFADFSKEGHLRFNNGELWIE